ncbi:MAG: hypothetical protein O2960_01955 [Verrucomicrobia bacterium]|nr:hypothetical protein [Verrucomicrobiota bacterium]
MRTPLQDRKLRDGVRSVLNTINQMFCAYFWKTCLETVFVTDATVHQARVGVENAAIESSLINIRAFDDFCIGVRKHSDDLVPSDFPGLSLGGAFLGDERRDINKQIAHLTHVSLGATTQPYPYKKILAAAVPRVREFCAYASTTTATDRGLAVFIDETLHVLEHVSQSYLNVELCAPPNIR